MKYNFYFKNIGEADKKTLREYFRKRLKKIIKNIAINDSKAGISSLSAEYHQKHNCFTTSVKIELPFTTLHGQEDSHNLLKPIDLIIDRLKLQMTKQKAKVLKNGLNSRSQRSLRKSKVIDENLISVVSEEEFILSQK